MADFVYKDYECKLKFGENEYNLPLNEQMADTIQKALSNKVMPPKFEGIEDINQFYNNVMDAVDEVLGAGAAEIIMSRFAHPGTMELLSVVNYILDEWNARYSDLTAEMKKTAHIPNREQHRNTNKGGRR